MGTIGLSFGSPTGGQGFDVAATVSQIVTGYQAVETPWKDSLANLTGQDSAFTQIGTDLATLATKLGVLTDFQGVLASKNGSSSDPSILALTNAQTGALAGSHSISVNQIAQPSSWYSDTVVNPGALLTGNLSIQMGSGSPVSIALGAAGETLSSLAQSINAAGLGATANVVSDASGARLSLVSNLSGTANALTITSSVKNGAANVNLQVGQSAQDAQLVVDGISLSDPTNTISNAIPGVTFQLLKANPTTQVQVQITNNSNAVASALNDFVNAYNTVAKDLSAQEGKDATGNAKQLFGSPSLSLLQQQLAGAVIAGAGTGIGSFSALGVSMNGDGTLTLNTDVFQSVLNSNFAGVTSFFQDASSIGAGFTQTLSRLSSTSGGAIYQALQANQTQERTLNANITREEQIIAQKKTSLTLQLQEANFALQEIPSQLNAVNELYAAISGYNGGK
jgi:flagellar hook-associated protein 2